MESILHHAWWQHRIYFFFLFDAGGLGLPSNRSRWRGWEDPLKMSERRIHGEGQPKTGRDKKQSETKHKDPLVRCSEN